MKMTLIKNGLKINNIRIYDVIFILSANFYLKYRFCECMCVCVCMYVFVVKLISKLNIVYRIHFIKFSQ
jgi:hypothetical protein